MGWHRRALHVNLTTRECRVEDIPEHWLQQYLGLRGLATRYMMELMDPATDPMSPDCVDAASQRRLASCYRPGQGEFQKRWYNRQR